MPDESRRLRRRPSLTPHTHAPRSRQPLHRQRRRQKYLRFRTWIKQKQCDTFNLMDLISKAFFQHCAQDTTLSKQHIDKAIVCAFVTPGCCKTISLTITAKEIDTTIRISPLFKGMFQRRHSAQVSVALSRVSLECQLLEQPACLQPSSRRPLGADRYRIPRCRKQGRYLHTIEYL